MIIKEGYPAEVYTVVTDDCYILEMHRIPHGKNEKNLNRTEPKQPVFLQHGILSSSADWVMGKSDRYLGELSVAVHLHAFF